MDFEDIFEAASQVFPLLLDNNEDQIFSILREGRDFENILEFSQKFVYEF